MDIRKLQRVIVDALDDVKAHDVRIFNTSEQTGLFDRVIVATGTSNRQTRALASHVREKAKAAGGHVISTEGEETGEWVLVDLGDAVVHIMQPAIRVYYNLEELWGSKPVQVKRSEPVGSSRSSRSAGKPVNDATEQAPARHAARKAPATSRSRGLAEVASEATAPTEAPAASETLVPTEAKTRAKKRVKAPVEATAEAAQADAKAPARRRSKEPAEATAEAPAQTEAKAPARRRSNKPAEATPEVASKAPRKRSSRAPTQELAERPAKTSSAAAALAPGGTQNGATTPKRRAPRKAGVG